MHRKSILNMEVTVSPYVQFVKEITDFAAARKSSYICVANVHMCIEAHDNKDFADVVNNADLVTPDGMPLAKAMKWLYGIEQERVAGMDLLPDLLREAEENNLNVYFYGGSEANAGTGQKICESAIPGTECGRFSQPALQATHRTGRGGCGEKY